MPGMASPPQTEEKNGDYQVTLSPLRRQQIGVTCGKVIYKPMSLTIRSYGNITYDEPELKDITVRVEGWITHLTANFQGKYVQKGEPLFTLYSPELYAAQKEYLQLLKRAQRTDEVSAQLLLKAAKERLKLWNISEGQIDDLASTNTPLENMPIVSPCDGYVIEKNVVEGNKVAADTRIFRIVPIEKVWLKAEIYQSDLLQIRPGDEATITLPYIPGKSYTAHVRYIYPYLRGNARTGQLLFQLDNPLQELLPDMYANVDLTINLGQRLQVPEQAVIYIGPKYFVFLDLGEGRLKPKQVSVGLKSQNYYEVLSGLKEGDLVVTSGNFLIAAESKFLSAIQYWGEEGESKK